MVKVKSKKATKKIIKKKLPVIQSAYEKKHKIPGIVMGFPGPLRTADTIHYLNKEGKLIHDSKMRTKSELKKLVMTQTEFNKRYDVKPKVKKKNPSTKSIRSNIHAIEKMKDELLTWNLKYDEFPNIKEFVNTNWELSFGKKEALSLLNAAASKRASSYWNTNTSYAADELFEASQAWRKVIDKLKGLEKLPEVKARVKLKEEPYVKDLRTKEDIDNWQVYPPISLDDFDF